MADYFKIGKIVSIFGLKGELILKHSLGKKTSLKGLEAIFLEERKDSFIPYFITTARIKTEDEIFVKLEGLDTKEQAMKLSQKEIWLPEEAFKKFSAKTAPISLLGFTIVDGDKSIGVIEEVIEQPHQMLCRITIQNKEVLIPLHQNTIEKIDRKKKLVIVQLPEGLLEIYL